MFESNSQTLSQLAPVEHNIVKIVRPVIGPTRRVFSETRNNNKRHAMRCADLLIRAKTKHGMWM